MSSASTWRQHQFAHYALAIQWLPSSEAREMYAYASHFNNNERYGLDPDHIDAIERFVARGHEAEASAWLRERIDSSDSVYVVYGRDDVAVMSADFLVSEWLNLLAPSRDDAILIDAAGWWVAFYCHEDEWEWGRPLSQEPANPAIKSMSS